MATTIRKFMMQGTAIGRWVYRYSRTETIGRVIDIVSDTHVLVDWVFSSGVVSGCSEIINSLNDFQSLIDDHAKKLATHTKTLEEANQRLSDVGE